MSGAIPCVCLACADRVPWLIPAGVSIARFLAAVKCRTCGARKLRADIPSERPTEPELPEDAA